MEFKRNINAYGLDISSTAVKVVQLRRAKKQIALEAYGQTILPKGSVVNDAIVDKKAFALLIKTALEKPMFGHLSAPYAVVSLPEAKSFVRVIQIPKMKEEEANNAVPFEAENFIPLPLDQVYLDWQKISDEGEKMNVLIIATPKDYVDSLLEILDEAGVRPAALEVESQSCHRAVIAKGSQETSLIVNIGSIHTNIIMVERGSLQFTSTVPIAGEAFTDAIAKALGVSAAKAQEVKSEIGIGNTVEYPNIKTACLPVLKTLAAEIKNILKFHSEHSSLPVEKMLLAGGGGRMKRLPEFLAEEFQDFPDLKIIPGNPWTNLPETAGRQLAGEDAVNFTTAIGLAMRGINL